MSGEESGGVDINFADAVMEMPAPARPTVEKRCKACGEVLPTPKRGGRPVEYCEKHKDDKAARNLANATAGDPAVVALRHALVLFDEHGPLLGKLIDALASAGKTVERAHEAMAKVATDAVPRIQAAEEAVRRANAEKLEALGLKDEAFEMAAATERVAQEEVKKATAATAEAVRRQRAAEAREADAWKAAGEHQKAIGKAEADAENALQLAAERKNALTEAGWRIQDLERQVAEAGEQLRKEKAELAAVSARLDMTAAELKYTEAIKDTASRERDALAGRIQRAEERVDDATARARVEAERAASAEATALALSDELARTRTELAAQTQAAADARAELKAAGRRIEELER